MTKKILIIDDEPEFLNFLKKELELRKYSVITAHDGQDGLTKIKECQPNLIICDFSMPNKNGFEVLKELRDSEDNATPFFMVSGVDNFEEARKTQDIKANLYLTKPFPLTVLLKNIKIFLGVRLQSKVKQNGIQK